MISFNRYYIFSALRLMFRRVISVVIISKLKIGYRNMHISWSATISPGCSIATFDSGSITIGRRSYLGPGAIINTRHGAIDIGPDVYIGPGAIIVARESIMIACDTQIAEYVTIRDQDHDFQDGGRIRSSGFLVSPISISSNVWLGAKCTILRGSTIGEGAVVGAHAVVRGAIPAMTIAVGIPARVVRSYRVSNST